MPSTTDFTLNVLVGGVPLPEYVGADGRHYVESPLTTPVSYKVETTEFTAHGDAETQKWPVTPYQVRIQAHLATPHTYYHIYVDGVLAKKTSIRPGASVTIHGFDDKLTVKEFLFSLPRFTKHEDDRLDKSRISKVGVIEVVAFNAAKVKEKMESRSKTLTFEQASKKDCSVVTEGKHTMSTTKVGKIVRQKALCRKVDKWRKLGVRSTAELHYRMGHSLEEMGFVLQPINVPIPSALPPSSSLPTKSDNLALKPGTPAPSANTDAADAADPHPTASSSSSSVATPAQEPKLEPVSFNPSTPIAPGEVIVLD